MITTPVDMKLSILLAGNANSGLILETAGRRADGQLPPEPDLRTVMVRY